MPSLNDIVAIASSFEKQFLAFARERCVRVRNRNARCSACVDACPFEVFSIKGNEVSIDNALCVNCGACVQVCPTEALRALNPSLAEVEEGANKLRMLNLSASVGTSEASAMSLSATSDLRPTAASSAVSATPLASAATSSSDPVCGAKSSSLVFACARKAAKKQLDSQCFVELPCLGHVSAALLLKQASLGAKEILLVDGNCETCKYGACVNMLNEMLAELNSLFDLQDHACRIVRSSYFPEQLLHENNVDTLGSTRRAFFSDGVSAVKDATIQAARLTLNEKLSFTSSSDSCAQVSIDGNMPKFTVSKHDDALNAIDALGVPLQGHLNLKLFGCVSINTEKCNSCGMCAVFCPSGALRTSSSQSAQVVNIGLRDKQPRNSMRAGGKGKESFDALEFMACDCIACGTCADICWKSCISIEHSISFQQLFSFDPIVFPLNS